MPASIRYMGSKKALAPSIAAGIGRSHPEATVVDVFAGTCAVATAVASKHRVVANDALAFAEVVARALLASLCTQPNVSEARADLDAACREHELILQRCIEGRLAEERAALSRCKNAEWRPLLDFTERELATAVPRFETTRENGGSYNLFSATFASTYLGVEQCGEIDCFRYAIDQAPLERRDYYLYALLVATSRCAAAPGHFAQFLVPRDESTTQLIASYRRRSLAQRFWETLRELAPPACVSRSENRVYRCDATAFANKILPSIPGEVIVYADPPYSRAQYSRYYHLLETLVLYDHPSVTGKGRYRQDRFETDFCRTAQVVRAMNEFVGAVAAAGTPLFLSYPKNGLLYKAGGDLRTLLERHYRHVSVATTKTLAHSTMGGAPGIAAIDVVEDVYYAHSS